MGWEYVQLQVGAGRKEAKGEGESGEMEGKVGGRK